MVQQHQPFSEFGPNLSVIAHLVPMHAIMCGVRKNTDMDLLAQVYKQLYESPKNYPQNTYKYVYGAPSKHTCTKLKFVVFVFCWLKYKISSSRLSDALSTENTKAAIQWFLTFILRRKSYILKHPPENWTKCSPDRRIHWCIHVHIDILHTVICGWCGGTRTSGKWPTMPTIAVIIVAVSKYIKRTQFHF